uniref:Homeobox protein ESX1-like n=2 Tax=Mustela putorius furo TaxID=9669 RepID=M3XQW5_MUSPF
MRPLAAALFRQTLRLLRGHAPASCSPRQVPPTTRWAVGSNEVAGVRVGASRRWSGAGSAVTRTPHRNSTPPGSHRGTKRRVCGGTLDMDPPPEGSQEGTAYHSLVDELQGEPSDMIPTVVSVMGGDLAKELWAESEQEAEAEESRGAGAAGPIDDENQKGGGGDGKEPPQQQQQDEALGASEGPQPQGKQQRAQLSTFTGLQLKELESIFQRSQYPDVFERKELAVPMDVMDVGEPEKNDSAEKPF